MARRLLPAAMATVVVLAACDSRAANDNPADSTDPRNQPGYIVDSIHPPEVALARFRERLARPAMLDGARSRDELLNRFMVAVRDTNRASLMALTINRAEFAYLIFPESRLYAAPYRHPPEIAWMMLRTGTSNGLRRLMARAAGGLEPLSYRCPAPAEVEGALRVTSKCVVRIREGGAEREVQLFGRIVERDGRWKFIALDGDL
ncbi:MAG: hypothetical protein WD801_07155 [Gemmatimonadaceae bacterium]